MTENDESLSQSCLVSVTWKYGGTAAFYDQCVWHIIIFSDVTLDTRYNCERHGTKTRCWWDRSCNTFVQDPEVMRKHRSRENTRAAFYRCVVLYCSNITIIKTRDHHHNLIREQREPINIMFQDRHSWQKRPVVIVWRQAPPPTPEWRAQITRSQSQPAVWWTPGRSQWRPHPPGRSHPASLMWRPVSQEPRGAVCLLLMGAGAGQWCSPPSWFISLVTIKLYYIFWASEQSYLFPNASAIILVHKYSKKFECY